MGKKYIIELLDDCPSEFKGIIVFGLTPEGQISAEPIPVEDLTPYTEPDLEQVRKEAYDNGYETAKHECEDCLKQAHTDALRMDAYQNGLLDAWEAARKICLDNDDGGIPASVVNDIFNVRYYRYALRDFSATEAIEKIRQYEQEKEEQIQVGDEVKGGDERYVVLQKYLNNIDELMVVLLNRRNGEIDKWHLYNANGVIFEKTGKHFPEIAAVLEKIREESNG